MTLSDEPLALLAALLALGAYALALAPAAQGRRWPGWALNAGWALHGLALVTAALSGGDSAAAGLRLGFAPVLSFTVWLVVGVYGLEARWLAQPTLRRGLALGAAAAVALALAYPGEWHAGGLTRWSPLHWVLGMASYGLFGVAVFHGLLLDASEQRLRRAGPAAAGGGLPLLTLERVTFRFVEGGFVVLTLALAVGLAEPSWRWGDRKTVLSLLGWAVLAALIIGRYWRGWRGRQATRWLYAGTLLLLLAYVGSRFVTEVVLHR